MKKKLWILLFVTTSIILIFVSIFFYLNKKDTNQLTNEEQANVLAIMDFGILFCGESLNGRGLKIHKDIGLNFDVIKNDYQLAFAEIKKKGSCKKIKKDLIIYKFTNESSKKNK